MRLELRPRPRIGIDCVFDTGVSLGEAAFRTQSQAERVGELVVDGHHLQGLGTEARLVENDEGAKMFLRWSPGEEPVQAAGDEATKMRSVRFSLFNFELRGLPYHDGANLVEQIELEDGDWSVRIRSLALAGELLKRKRREGGVYLTHADNVGRADGGEFTGSEAADMLTAVEHYLWFVTGEHVELCCPVGTDVRGDSVWSRWSSPDRWDEGRLSWLDRREPEQTGKLFRGFMDTWRRGDWHDALQKVVYWYGLANDSARGIDAGIVSAQTALERLAFECCVVEWKQMSRKAFKGKSAAEVIRTLLGKLGVPVAVPGSATGLTKAGPRRNPEWADGVQAVTEIRNDLAHGGRRRLSLPAECYIEAWTLAVWYVEMAVLALCGYADAHWNRNTRTEEQVPWAAARQT